MDKEMLTMSITCLGLLLAVFRVTHKMLKTVLIVIMIGIILYMVVVDFDAIKLAVNQLSV